VEIDNDAAQLLPGVFVENLPELIVVNSAAAVATSETLLLRPTRRLNKWSWRWCRRRR
jgi:hypothetical protein